MNVIILDTATDLSHRIAERVRSLRSSRGVSLQQLADGSGVSRSMISLIERGESSPTAAVLEKLSTALGVPLAALFDVAPAQTPSPLSRRADPVEWKDPASGYVRRNVSPAGTKQPIHIVEVKFPPGQRVAFDNAARHTGLCQQVWVLDGAMDIVIGGERHRLESGDCLAMTLDQPVMFHNSTRKPARYAVVIGNDGSAR